MAAVCSYLRVAPVLSILCGLLSASPAYASDEYALGSNDKLRISVVEWFPASGDLRSPIAGEYMVGPAGAVSLPLLGEVEAAGKTAAQLSATISERLQGKLGLEGRPSTSVEVVQFRPFYVAGSVERPGEFPFRPRMTVLHALSLAGGLQRRPDGGLLQLERDTALAEEEVDTLAIAIDEHMARQARLTAELHQAKSIEFGSDLLSRKANAGVAQLMRLEEIRFETSRRLFSSSIEAQRFQVTLLEKELRSIQARTASLAMEQEAVDRQLAQMQRLEVRGLAAGGRTLDLMRARSEIAGKQRDLDIQALRVQQDRARIEDAVSRASDQRRHDMSAELQQLKAKLVELWQRLETNKRLIALAGAARGRGVSGEPAYTLVRDNGTSLETLLDVPDDTPLKAGDVLKVEQGSRSRARVSRVEADGREASQAGGRK